MTIEEAIELVRARWDHEGECASCGWHAALYEYGDLSDAISINEHKGRIEMSCLGEAEDSDSHRGVRIYFYRDPDRETESHG